MSRVLMVDDAWLFQALEGSFLRRTGCEIVRASSAPDILDKARGRAPDLIVLDGDRPGMGSPECLRALKSDPSLRAIPVLVLCSEAIAPGLAGEGADRTLVRPVGPAALEAALSDLGRVARRGGVRRPLRAAARIALPSGSLRGRVKDISRTGLFLALRRPVPTAAPLGLSLALPVSDRKATLRLRGIVVRQVPVDPASHLIPGVGVRFVELDPPAESLLDRFLNQAIPGDAPAAATVAFRDGA